MIGDFEKMNIKQEAEKAAAVYANKFYVQPVDGGQNLKLVFFEELSNGECIVRGALLLSRQNVEALLNVSADVLQAGKKENS